MMVFATPLFFQGLEMITFVIGLLFVVAIFETGWFGGDDAQLAFGLIALGRDWWMLVYLLGGTILLAIILVARQRGVHEAVKRFQWVFTNLDTPDECTIRIPWAVIAAVEGTIYFWIHPGTIWRVVHHVPASMPALP